MFKKAGVFLITMTILFAAGCQKDYEGEYVEWGEENTDEERLEDNDIPYEIRDGQIYIPEDALNDAVICCS